MTGADPAMIAHIRANLDAYHADTAAPWKRRESDVTHAARLAVDVGELLSEREELLALVERVTRPPAVDAVATGTGWPA
jgi:hypothetical protein